VIPAPVVDWWRRRRFRAARIKTIVTYDRQSELPQSISRKTIAVVGSLERPKWAALECPCGAGHRLMINLSPSHKPSWEFTNGAGGPSLRPSIDFDDGDRRCHFWLRSGKVTWCRDAQRGASGRAI
jgi:hypothetical protein